MSRSVSRRTASDAPEELPPGQRIAWAAGFNTCLEFLDGLSPKEILDEFYEPAHRREFARQREEACRQEKEHANRARAEELARRGYRRISSKYGLVARVDRPDWIMVLAAHLHRSPAEFYLVRQTSAGDGEQYAIDSNHPSPMWADHYRRTYSRDKFRVDPEVAKFLRDSEQSYVDYVAQADGEDARRG